MEGILFLAKFWEGNAGWSWICWILDKLDTGYWILDIILFKRFGRFNMFKRLDVLLSNVF